MHRFESGVVNGLVGAALVLVVGVGCASDGAQPASAALVKSVCRARIELSDECNIGTGGQDERKCIEEFGTRYRTDVLEHFRDCMVEARRACLTTVCDLNALRDLGLEPDQNEDDPLQRACGGRFRACQPGVLSLDIHSACDTLLLYTPAVRELAERCFTEAIPCSQTVDCIKTPEAF